MTVLIIDGRLKFDNKDIILKANHIYVRKGELLIGEKTRPHENLAIIEL